MIQDILGLIEKHGRFFISTHIRPDGDAVGSELALAHFLKRLGKEVAVINSDPPPMNMDWLPGVEMIQVFDGSLEQREAVNDAEVLFILDTNAMDRLGKLVGPVRNSDGVKALIDHHTHPEAWFDVMFERETASATGELVYEIIAAYDPEMIDATIAMSLYAAIVTDTGSFRYSNVTPALHRAVADILERGDVNPAPIHTAVYDTRSPESLQLLGRVLETITLRFNGEVAYMVITPRMLRETGASSEDTEGFVNYALSIEGVRVAMMFLETEKGTKISFRSKADAHVNEWARAFGGGGHKNASGAYLREPLDEAVEQVVGAAPRFLAVKPEDGSDVSLSDEDATYLSTLMELKSQGK